MGADQISTAGEVLLHARSKAIAFDMQADLRDVAERYHRPVSPNLPQGQRCDAAFIYHLITIPSHPYPLSFYDARSC